MDGGSDPEVEQLDELLLDEDGVDEALGVALDVVRTTIGGEPHVSLTVRPRDGRGPSTRGATDPVARQLDEWQYEHGQGPCVTADREAAVCAVDDLEQSELFDEFAIAALAIGVRGAASFPLLVRNKSIGSLNLFYRDRGMVDQDIVRHGQQLAKTVAPLLANFLTHQRTVTLTNQLEEALEGRSVIERAKGLLMGQLGVNAQQAFELLSTQSQHENRKLRMVAHGLLEQHESKSGGAGSTG
jgi:GAF domain-containing protein